MSAIGWTAIKDALHAWLVAEAGLPADRVLFGGQNAVRPAGIDTAWVSIWIMGAEEYGQSAVVYIDNPTPSPGAELIKQVHGQALVTCELTCFGPRNASDATEPYALLFDAIAATELDEVSDPLVDAGVGINEFSAILTVGGVFNTSRVEPRATCTLTFYTPTLVQRPMTFIEHVNVTLNVDTNYSVKTFVAGFETED